MTARCGCLPFDLCGFHETQAELAAFERAGGWMGQAERDRHADERADQYETELERMWP